MTQTALGPTPFFKMHGLGNDFVVIDTRGRATPMTPTLARAIGDRRRGVGFDQLITIAPPNRVGAAARLSFWNSDGSLSGACGNGTRCVAELLMAEAGADAITLETDAGLLPARRRADGLVEVDMGRPKLDWRDIPLAEASDTLRIDVKLGPIDNPALWGPSAVNMGNPHAVFFVEDLAATPVEKLGPFLEHHPMFPERANIEFVKVEARDRLRARVWERGAGVTQACGSGACAILVAAVRRGLADRRAEVALDGGSLFVDWPRDDAGVRLSGPTAMVFAGALSDDFLANL